MVLNIWEACFKGEKPLSILGPELSVPCQCYPVTEGTREQKWMTCIPGKQTKTRSSKGTGVVVPWLVLLWTLPLLGNPPSKDSKYSTEL